LRLFGIGRTFMADTTARRRVEISGVESEE
jgi:hypothetical protein